MNVGALTLLKSVYFEIDSRTLIRVFESDMNFRKTRRVSKRSGFSLNLATKSAL